MIEQVRRLRDWFQRRRLDGELDVEMRAHFEMLVREEMANGRTIAEARHLARLRFGSFASVAEDTRARWGFAWLHEVVQDLRYGARGLRRSPLFTIAASITLALGVGASSAVFVVMQRTMLSTLPVRDPQQLVRIVSDRGVGGVNQNLSYPLFAMLRRELTAMEHVAAHVPVQVALNAIDGSTRIAAGALSSNFFAMLGAPMSIGREFSAEEERGGGAAVAILSHSEWMNRGAPPDVIGSSISINGQQFVVIGVAAESFTGPVLGAREQLWIPLGAMERLGLPAGGFDESRASWLFVFGRMRDGIVASQAQANLASLDAVTQSAQLRQSGERGLLQDGSRGLTMLTMSVEQPLKLLLIATLAVLLIGCANIAGLLLSRADARRKEFTVRYALGADRFRLVRQLLTENFLLAAVSGAIALIIAYAGLRFLTSYGAIEGSLTIDNTLNVRSVAMTLAAALATTLLFGLVPALRTSRLDRTRRRRSPTISPMRSMPGLRSVLIVVQVALSLSLVTGATMLVRSLQNLQRVDIGYGQDRAVLASLDLEQGGYTRETGVTVIRSALERLSAIPGVGSASAASLIHPVPYGSRWDGMVLDGYTKAAEQPVGFDVTRVAPKFFATMRMPLVAGREFGDGDVRGAPNVAIVNETFVAKYLEGRNPIGVSFRDGPEPNARRFEIVGVARDGKYRELREAGDAGVYLPLLQHYTPSITVVLATTVDPAVVMPEVRRTMTSVNPSIPLYNVRTLAQHVATASARERMVTSLSSAFGVIALLLASVGVFGLIAYTVAQQTREIGIRIALGSTTGAVVRMMVGRGAALIFAGMAVGLIGVWYVGRITAGFLFGVASTDVQSLLVASSVLVTSGLLAAWFPARRAARVDPTQALRDG